MVATFENCEIFSTYYFSNVRGYKATLRGDNEETHVYPFHDGGRYQIETSLYGNDLRHERVK